MHTEILPQSVAMIVLDQDGLFFGMNPAAEELLGDNVLDFINNWLPLQSADVIDFINRSIRVDTLKTAEATYLMLFDDHTPPVSNRVYELASREINLPPRDLKREQDMMTIKAKSTAMIAHKFGTPISAVRLKSYLLKTHLDSLSKERITEHLEQIEAQLDHMVDLLDDLLLINQAYSSEQVATLSPLDLEAYCNKLIDQLTVDWEGHTVFQTYSGRMSNVQLDRRLIRYVISNLIESILKYTGSTIRVDVRRVENTITFTVSAPDTVLAAHEFDKLQTQLSRPNGAGALNGMGLNLSVMKTCVEMYGGTIKVSSKPAQGTSFVVNLPCRDA